MSGQLLESGKDEEMDSLLEPTEECSPSLAVLLAQ